MDHYTPFSPKGGQNEPNRELPPVPEADVSATAAVNVEPDEPTRVEYVKNMMPPTAKPKKKWPLVALAVLMVAALAGGGYWYWYVTQHKSKPPIVHKSSGSQLKPAPVESSTAGTPQYVSNGSDLNLDFNYPSNWTVSPPSNDNKNDQTITATSPLTTMTTASGTSVTGKVVVSIRPGTSSLSELDGTTTAQASVQIAYSKPTSAQYQYPYLTFIHVPGVSDVAGSFDEVVVTGTTQFPQGTSLSQASVEVDPIISASFYSCSTQTCTASGQKPVSITNDSWQNDSIFQQSLAVFQSMQLN